MMHVSSTTKITSQSLPEMPSRHALRLSPCSKITASILGVFGTIYAFTREGPSAHTSRHIVQVENSYAPVPTFPLLCTNSSQLSLAADENEEAPPSIRPFFRAFVRELEAIVDKGGPSFTLREAKRFFSIEGWAACHNSYPYEGDVLSNHVDDAPLLALFFLLPNRAEYFRTIYDLVRFLAPALAQARNAADKMALFQNFEMLSTQGYKWELIDLVCHLRLWPQQLSKVAPFLVRLEDKMGWDFSWNLRQYIKGKDPFQVLQTLQHLSQRFSDEEIGFLLEHHLPIRDDLLDDLKAISPELTLHETRWWNALYASSSGSAEKAITCLASLCRQYSKDEIERLIRLVNEQPLFIELLREGCDLRKLLQVNYTVYPEDRALAKAFHRDDLAISWLKESTLPKAFMVSGIELTDSFNTRSTLFELQDNYNVQARTAKNIDELYRCIEQAIDEGPPEVLVIHAHGTPESIQVDGTYSVVGDRRAAILKKLPEGASIILCSCKTGAGKKSVMNIANFFASLAPQAKVFAPTEIVNPLQWHFTHGTSLSVTFYPKLPYPSSIVRAMDCATMMSRGYGKSTYWTLPIDNLHRLLQSIQSVVDKIFPIGDVTYVVATQS